MFQVKLNILNLMVIWFIISSSLVRVHELLSVIFAVALSPTAVHATLVQ